MDFSWGERNEAFRREVRVFLAEHYPPDLEETVYRTGVSHDDGFVRALAERGWVAPGWAREGHRVLDRFQQHILKTEMTRVDAPTYALETTIMVARVIDKAGSDRLKADVLPRVLRGEAMIALGMTEPDAGSDVAAITTRARRDGDDWIVDGQKMFTTNAHITDFVFLLVRTSHDKPRHKGLTTFLLPMDLPGIETQAVHTLSGERTNIVFLSGVQLEDRWRIGEIDGGWSALMLALQDEHSAAFSPHLSRLIEEVEAWAANGHDDRRPLDDPDTRVRIARWATALEVGELLEARTVWMESFGRVPIAEGPMSKLFSTEAIVRAAEDLTELVGPDALRSKLDPSAVQDGRIEHALRFSLGTTIYAGTSEIQRTIIAQHACGLPR
jgi:alkylation response protein AidB-like acyl-CoA dehydrogenase